MSHNIILPHNYKCRDYQKSFWQAMQSGVNRAVLVWHRRAGKEKTCWNYMICQAVRRVGVYYYVFPDSKMGRRIIWDNIDKYGFKLLHHIPEPMITNVNNTEMKIVLRNGSVILVLGSRDVDSLRGPNPVGVVFSEYSEQHPMAWQTVSPILRENDGWAIFNFTPKGQNHAKYLYDNAMENMSKGAQSWFCELLTIDDTGAFTKEDIEKERKESRMSEDMIQQEYYCSFTLGIDGSYYAKYLKDAEDENRVGKVPYDKHARVNTAWDIGYGDSTSIVFFQMIGKEVHIIDYYENSGEGLPHYAEIIKNKNYIYDSHYAPHDIRAHEFSQGLSPEEVGKSLGINFNVLPTLKIGLENGIEALRSIFPRIWINKDKCDHLVECLRNYRKEFDQKHEVYRERPVHNWASHCADACRYMALAVKIYGDISHSIDDKQAEEWFDKFNPIFER
jgi:phage terminase large subunit